MNESIIAAQTEYIMALNVSYYRWSKNLDHMRETERLLRRNLETDLLRMGCNEHIIPAMINDANDMALLERNAID